MHHLKNISFTTFIALCFTVQALGIGKVCADEESYLTSKERKGYQNSLKTYSAWWLRYEVYKQWFATIGTCTSSSLLTAGTALLDSLPFLSVFPSTYAQCEWNTLRDKDEELYKQYVSAKNKVIEATSDQHSVHNDDEILSQRSKIQNKMTVTEVADPAGGVLSFIFLDLIGGGLDLLDGSLDDGTFTEGFQSSKAAYAETVDVAQNYLSSENSSCQKAWTSMRDVIDEIEGRQKVSDH